MGFAVSYRDFLYGAIYKDTFCEENTKYDKFSEHSVIVIHSKQYKFPTDIHL